MIVMIISHEVDEDEHGSDDDDDDIHAMFIMMK